MVYVDRKKCFWTKSLIHPSSLHTHNHSALSQSFSFSLSLFFLLLLSGSSAFYVVQSHTDEHIVSAWGSASYPSTLQHVESNHSPTSRLVHHCSFSFASTTFFPPSKKNKYSQAKIPPIPKPVAAITAV